jgi:uncharacterized protein YbcC (UPF0753/DUF2309 family)
MPQHPEIAALRADVATAVKVVAPVWPLTSFVAVNPLGGLEHLPFEEATAQAERLFGARTHLPLEWYRAARERGAISDADLRFAITEFDPVLASRAPLVLGGSEVDVVELVLHDLVHGPVDPQDGSASRDDSVESFDRYIASWCAAFADEAGVPVAMPDRHLGFFRAWRALAPYDRRLVDLIGRPARSWISLLPDDPVLALDAALAEMGVARGARIEVIRGLAARLPGWVGFARWCDEWAPADHAGPRIRVIDLVAVLAVLDASVGARREVAAAGPPAGSLDRRVQTALERWVDGAPNDDERRAVMSVLDQIPERARSAIWLAAHESNLRDRFLTLMHRADPGATDVVPNAQMVTCIDVRSEPLRRHLEALGRYETFGFAGFFGVPVRWRPLGSSRSEARCPVLVSPRHEISEVASASATGRALGAGHVLRCAGEAFHDAKGSLGSPFAMAESAGWALGPIAATRTLLTPRRARAGRRRRMLAPSEATVVVASDPDGEVGLPIAERVLFAEAIVSTIGFRRFAPIVLLCGHASRTVNNPHASSLDCGACGGAPGGASARIAAAILNDPMVRDRLRERGTDIGVGTWFVAAEHETTSDTVTVLDRHLVPENFAPGLAELERSLAIAAERTSAERARRLPGDPRRVRARGRDWAQVRPEWGLAGNAAFVVGPRSITRDLDLGGRVFLHSHVADDDPDGVALETILTAPLIVAQWISSQYYFSTVDPDVFGAGDKMLHNPVGGIGVVLGDGGDLAVGLPRQSVMVGERLAHEPVRLLAVVQAPLERIEQIISRNTGLRHLIQHGWIKIAARSHGHEPWSLRTRAGTWHTWHPAAHTPSASITLELR